MDCARVISHALQMRIVWCYSLPGETAGDAFSEAILKRSLARRAGRGRHWSRWLLHGGGAPKGAGSKQTHELDSKSQGANQTRELERLGGKGFEKPPGKWPLGQTGRHLKNKNKQSGRFAPSRFHEGRTKQIDISLIRFHTFK